MKKPPPPKSKVPFDESAAYTLDGTDIFFACLWGQTWVLWDPNKSKVWKSRFDTTMGFVEGYFLYPDHPLYYGKVQVNERGQLDWVFGPESADLWIEDFQTCGVGVKAVKLL